MSNENENDDIEIIQDISSEIMPIEDVVDLSSDEPEKDPNKVNPKEIARVEKEIESIREKNAENDKFGFIYRSNCRTCNYALNDPDVHKIYLDHDFSIAPVVEYITEKYAAIAWDQVKSHMEHHFMPKYKEAETKRKDFLTMVKTRLREKEKKSGTRIEELQEILFMKIEEMCIYTDIKNSRENRENAKVIGQLSMSLKSLYELQYKLLGIDEDPEEHKKKMQGLLKAQFGAALMRIPEDKRKEFMEYIYKKD